ncbi:MAG: PRC-barrel domain-containing protein, partial [Phycisphaerae bacterium]|nr:PRC-barrel domain-containing protein [Phycisphaerae bacterium]
MTTNSRTLSACVLAAVVGGCLSVAAQPGANNSNNQQLPPRTAQRTDARPSYDYASRTFASADKLRGSTVENAAKKNIGTVSDLIIDRGSGAVTYVVLNAGGFLGIGTKKVAIPFASFGWNSADRALTLETTVEQAKAWPEFDEKTWSGTEESLSSRLGRDYYRTPQNYYPSATSNDDTHIKGTVTRVDRRAIPGTATEEVVVTVRTSDGREQDVVLGPSYYISNNSNAVYRDAPIDVRVSRMDRNGTPVVIARSYNINSKDTALYDDSGKAHWWSWKSTPAQPIGYPFLLNSDVDGKHITARGEKCGKIEDLIVETGTGRVAFVSIDPDQNVLGIADTKRLVPWGVITLITTDGVSIDASKAMITSAPETPKDLAMLSGDSKYQNIYQGYGISEPYYYDRNWDNNSWNNNPHNPSDVNNHNNPNRRDRDL